MERISTHQFTTLGASVLMGGTFILIASFVTQAGGRDGWMAVLPGFALAIPYSIMVFSLSAQYPHKNLLQISEKLFGKWIGKFVGVIYTLISSYYGGLLLTFIGIIYEQAILPLMPRWVFYLGGFLLVFYLVNSGIEVFARFSEVIFPVILIAMLMNAAFNIPRVEQGELLPILGEGLSPLFLGMFSVMPFSMVYILFLAGIVNFLPNSTQELAQLRAGTWWSVFGVGTMNTLLVLIQILVFGPSETVRLAFGILELGKMVEISRTVSGVESLFMGVWLGALVIKCCSFFFMTIWGIETVFNFKGLKWRFAIGAIFLGIAFTFMRGPSFSMELSYVEKYLIFPFAFVWIPLLWGISRWKQRPKAKK